MDESFRSYWRHYYSPEQEQLRLERRRKMRRRPYVANPGWVGDVVVLCATTAPVDPAQVAPRVKEWSREDVASFVRRRPYARAAENIGLLQVANGAELLSFQPRAVHKYTRYTTDCVARDLQVLQACGRY